MLETLDLTLALDKAPYRRALDRLDLELPILQRGLRTLDVPVLVLVEGWFASGRGDSIGQFVHRVDPRATRVHVTHASSEEERRHPWQWRFWRRLPSRGSIAVFDRSWYYLLWNRRHAGEFDDGRWERELQAITAFEELLTAGGTLVVKLWLHVDRAEQKRRLQAWRDDDVQRWRVSDEDWKRHKDYRERLPIAEELLARTHTHRAPWTLVAATDGRHRRVAVLTALAAAMRAEIERRGATAPTPEELLEREARAAGVEPERTPDPLGAPPPARPDSPLARVDTSLTLEREIYSRRLKTAQRRLRDLEFRCYRARLPVVIVFEGWDAAGKGGAIRRLTERLDPRGYAVIPIAAPTERERGYHYLWRFWSEAPKDGHWTIYDRSWYGRVLVERVEGFAREDEWRRAYQEINEFERSLATHGTVVIKFWLQISAEEQLRRFRRREESPLRRHKITDEDWRNRIRWPQYVDAVSDMLRQTSTADAPWTVVEAEDKRWARVKVVETVIDAVEPRLASS